jgi:predicted Na+-dependent transporter
MSGNTLGVLISPLLNQLYFSAPGWELGRPIAEGGVAGLGGLGEVYRRVMMKLGLAIFVPSVSTHVVKADFRLSANFCNSEKRLDIVLTIAFSTSGLSG